MAHSRLNGAVLSARESPRREGGFSLVELMVVIVIIGLAATAVMLAVPEPGGSVRAEAERFAARAKAARDSAIVESRPVRIELDAQGYAVARRSGGEWRQTARYAWADGTEAEAGSNRLRFDSTGLAEPMHLALRRGGRRAAVAISADGTVHVAR